MKLKLLVAFGLFVLLGLLASVFYAPFSSKQGPVQPDHIAALSGFKPGADVTYHVASESGENAGGVAIIDPEGNLKIPRGNTKLARDSALTYNIQVDQSNRPVHLNFKIDADGNRVVVSGRGAQEFSDILIETVNDDHVVGQSKTKADWAGFFNTQSALSADSTKLVFYDNIQSDAQAYKPLMIEVYSAPGGGTKDKDKVNEYTNLHCVADPTELSVCDEAKMDENNEKIFDHYVVALGSMTEQFSAIMMQQVAIIGTFIDAKMQMETQREFQKLQAEAVKDYHPDEQLCRFGSFVKTVAKTEETVDLNKVALSNILTNTYVNKEHSSSAEGYDLDIQARIDQFKQRYCDPADNNNGLGPLCDNDTKDRKVKHWYKEYSTPKRVRNGKRAGGANSNYGPVTVPEPAPDASDLSGAVSESAGARLNKDIDYQRTVESKLSLDVDFVDTEISEAEEDVVALARNLYWPRAMAPLPDGDRDNYIGYMDGRRIAAIHNVAHHSFTEIVALKSKSIAEEDDQNGPAFMKALMKDFGLEPEDIDDLLGEFPSYYAQMEVLTKKIYQHPDFYTNLYTKPANVARIKASLDAVHMMQGRDQFDAALRREMLTSLMVEEALAKHVNKVNDRLRSESTKF